MKNRGYSLRWRSAERTMRKIVPPALDTMDPFHGVLALVERLSKEIRERDEAIEELFRRLRVVESRRSR